MSGSQSAMLVESIGGYTTLYELAGLETPTNLEGKTFANSLRDPSVTGVSVAFHVDTRG